jgi:SAM-dependent methyltransferase
MTEEPTPNPAASVSMFDFGAVARAYDETIPFFSTVGEVLAESVGIEPGDRVLDVGAGRRAVTFPILQRLGPSGSVLAVDLANAMMARLAQVGDHRLTTAVADAQDLTELGDASFDVVTAGFVLHIVPDRKGALREIFRVLRPGGRLGWSMPGAAVDGGWGEYYGAVFAEFAALVEAPAGMDEPDTPLSEIAAAAGFVDEQVTVAEVHLPVGGPAGYWDWLMSHGQRWLYDSLDPENAAEFRQRVLAGFASHHLTGGQTLELAPTVHRHRRPPAGSRR